jgi:hypothetical protein
MMVHADTEFTAVDVNVGKRKRSKVVIKYVVELRTPQGTSLLYKYGVDGVELMIMRKFEYVL